MMPGLEIPGIGFAIVLMLMAISSVFMSLTALVLLLRGKASWKFACVVGTISLVFFALFLVSRLATRALLPSSIVAVFFLPAALGLLSVGASLVAAWRARLRGAPIAIPATIFVAGLFACVYICVIWRSMELRGGLWHAVLAEDVPKVRRLLVRGAARDDADRPFRQRLLVHAAKDVNVELVVVLLDAGADPNVAHEGTFPLVSAIGADPILRLHPIDEENHARNRLSVVTVLLDRGASPNPVVAEGKATPAEVAWAIGDDELLRLLDARGANDAQEVVTRFEELLAAAASGDAVRVAEIARTDGPRLQFDAKNRSPLVVAAEHGQLAIIETLLGAYGGFVKCDIIERSLEAAATNGHAGVYERLLEVCFNEYNAGPLIVAATSGNADLIRATVAKGYSVNLTESGTRRTALDAAVAGGHLEAVQVLIAAGASVDPERIPVSADPEIRTLLDEAVRSRSRAE